MVAGRPPKVTDAELVEILHSADTPVLTAKEVASSLPIGERAVFNRLSTLYDREIINRKEVGGNSVWWLPESLSTRSWRLTDQITQERDQYKHADSSPELAQPVSGEIEELDIPATKETEKVRRQAVAAAYDFLREKQEAPKRDFVDELYDGYSVGYGNPRSWWENLIRPALKDLATVENATQKGTWRYRGDSTDAGAAELRRRLPEDISELNELLFDEWTPEERAKNADQLRDVGKEIIRLLAEESRLERSEILSGISLEPQSHEFEQTEVWEEILLPPLKHAEWVGIVRQEPVQGEYGEWRWIWQVIPSMSTR